MDRIWDKIKEPEQCFRPHPFWAWNDKLDVELCRQEIDEMEKAGAGGFFMHARTGLSTEYLSEEWMEAVESCIQYAAKKGLRAWGYDEDGWPSGFAGGMVQKECPETVITWIECVPAEELSFEAFPAEVLLRFRPGEYSRRQEARAEAEKAEWEKAKQDKTEQEWAVVVRSNVGYVDLLNLKTTETFIRLTHEKYKERLSEKAWREMGGFFTDEPQFKRENIPWSVILEEEFETAFGYPLREKLPALFFDVDGAEAVRYDFYSLVSRLFVKSFTEQLYDWHMKNGLGFTGHFLNEDSLFSQMHGSAGVMPHYEYMTLPGMDWLGRKIGSPLIPKQASSVAAQTGKGGALAETFALCGWNVSFEELKWIAHWQMVNGVTLICQHLEGYTLRGSRKRDYPPSLFYQQPYWSQYRRLNDYFGRIGQLYAETKEVADICILHPIRSAWVCYSERDGGRVHALDQSLNAVSRELSDRHLPWHYVDEGMLARLGEVSEPGVLKVGECSYHAVVLPALYSMDSSTLRLLERFAAGGGLCFSFGELPQLLGGRKCPGLAQRLGKFTVAADGERLQKELAGRSPYDIRILDETGKEAGDIHVMCREKEGFRIYFLANLSRDKDVDACLSMKGADSVWLWDLWEYQKRPLEVRRQNDYGAARVKLHAMEAAVLVCEPEKRVILPAKRLTVRKAEYNSINLDCAEYRMDGEWRPAKAVVRIMKELLEQRFQGEVELRFTCDIRVDPKQTAPVYLVIESPDRYEIAVNGRQYEFREEGFWRDSSFRKSDVGNWLRQGRNEILLRTSFWQKPKVYETLFGKEVMETERNKLTFDTELESIYLCGAFGVYDEASAAGTDKNAYITEGKFYLGEFPKELEGKDFSRQGLQFYAGNLELVQELILQEKGKGRYVLRFERKPDCAVMEILVNGQMIRTYAGGSLETDMTDALRQGRNEICYRFGGTNRNLLGPHHFSGGESWAVGPDTFGEKGGWTEPEELQGKDIWTDTYCFVRFGF